MKKLMLSIALATVPMAASAEIVVLSDQTVQRECTVPSGSCTEYYRVTTFYDTISRMYCIDQAESLQCVPVESLYNSFKIKDLVKKKKAEQTGN